MQLHVASLDLKWAFDKASPPLLSEAMKDFSIHPTLATAMLREQLGGKNHICFQERHSDGNGVDRSIKQEGWEKTTVLEVQEANSVVSDQERTWRCW